MADRSPHRQLTVKAKMSEERLDRIEHKVEHVEQTVERIEHKVAP